MEKETKNQQQESLNLERAYTFFMVPFYFEKDEWDAIYLRSIKKRD